MGFVRRLTAWSAYFPKSWIRPSLVPSLCRLKINLQAVEFLTPPAFRPLATQFSPFRNYKNYKQVGGFWGEIVGLARGLLYRFAYSSSNPNSWETTMAITKKSLISNTTSKKSTKKSSPKASNPIAAAKIATAYAKTTFRMQ